jgi:hypothetical protein
VRTDLVSQAHERSSRANSTSPLPLYWSRNVRAIGNLLIPVTEDYFTYKPRTSRVIRNSLSFTLRSYSSNTCWKAYNLPSKRIINPWCMPSRRR